MKHLMKHTADDTLYVIAPTRRKSHLLVYALTCFGQIGEIISLCLTILSSQIGFVADEERCCSKRFAVPEEKTPNICYLSVSEKRGRR